MYCSSANDQSYLDWISNLNPEANTYQFLVKARPITMEEKYSSEYQFLESRDTIVKLQAKIEAIEKENNKLKSQMNWIENNRFGVLTRLLNAVFKKG